MTTTPIPPPISDDVVQPSPASGQRRWPKRVGSAAALVVALGVGSAIGATVASNTAAVNAANQKVAAAHRQIGTLQSQVSTLRSQASTMQSQASTLQAQYQQAKTNAQNAAAIANTKASSAWASRNAALSQRAATLNAQAKNIAAETGNLQANQISADGVYVVGHDIKAGIWHTNGDNGAGGNACYFATLNSTDTSNIADNNNFDGPETVNVNAAYAFEISGPCTWVKVG